MGDNLKLEIGNEKADSNQPSIKIEKIKENRKIKINTEEKRNIRNFDSQKPKAQHSKPLAENKKLKFSNLKLFNKWDTNIAVNDLGLKPYINLSQMIVPVTHGRSIKKQFWKSKKHIVERLALKLMVTGHKGKKHYMTSGLNTGKISTQMKIIQKAFGVIEQKTKKNPLEILVRAIEAGSPREGVATIEYGGVRYPKAADLTPQRRIDLVLRWITQSAFLSSLRGKKHIWEALADEIIATANNEQAKSSALAKKTDMERQAGASR